MAIAEVQAFTTATAAANNVTLVYGATPTAGNLLVATGKSIGGVIGGATMPAGWVLATSALVVSPDTVGIWYKTAGASEPTSVQLTWTSSTTTRLGLAEYSGITTPTLDQIANNNNTGAVTSKATGTTAATAVNDELCIAAVGTGNSISAESWSNSFAAKLGSALFAGTNTMIVAHKIVSATGTQTTTLSWTTTRVAGGCIATFMAGAAASAPIKTINNINTAVQRAASW